MGGRASKAKGSNFERLLCRKFSLWLSRGKDEDLLWRSSLSGGRATIAQRKGRNVRQSGDICAVAPDGHRLTDHYFLECKAYRNLNMAKFLLCNAGPLMKFWKIAKREALKYGKFPLLVARQNGLPAVLIVTEGPIADFLERAPGILPKDGACTWLLDEVLKMDCPL